MQEISLKKGSNQMSGAQVPLCRDISISRLTQADLPMAAEAHSLAFPRQQRSEEWLAAKLRSFPATYSYVASLAGHVVGGILWTHKSGFRNEAVLELEQIFVRPEMQRKGVGSALILNSLAEVNASIEKEGCRIGTLCVNTRSDNNALKLYERTLGVKKVAELTGHTPNATEVFLAATSVNVAEILNKARP